MGCDVGNSLLDGWPVATNMKEAGWERLTGKMSMTTTVARQFDGKNSPCFRHVHGKFLDLETKTEIGITIFMAYETGHRLGLDIF